MPALPFLWMADFSLHAGSEKEKREGMEIAEAVVAGKEEKEEKEEEASFCLRTLPRATIALFVDGRFQPACWVSMGRKDKRKKKITRLL